jgi:hypothetical protein
MAIVPLPLPPGAEARALLHHLLAHGDIVGRDAIGRTVVQLAVDDWALEKLLTFDAEATDLEDGGDDEPDADDEEDGPPVVVELVRPTVIGRRRATCQVSGEVG